MAETKPIPVRLPEDTQSRIDRAVERINAEMKEGYGVAKMTRAGLIRMLIETWLDQFDQAGRAALPVNWAEVMTGWDGRRKVETSPMGPTAEEVSKYRQKSQAIQGATKSTGKAPRKPKPEP